MGIITSARALYNLNNYSHSVAEGATIEELVEAATDIIERYCRRKFLSATYDHLFNGTRTQHLLLREYPLLQVYKVLFDPAPVLRIRNTATGTNQRARVYVDPTAASEDLLLVRTASGTDTTSTLAFASYATLGDLVTAVNALGNGWEARTVSSDYDNFDTVDTFEHLQGSYNALGNWADLYAHVEELEAYDVDTDKGLLIRRDNQGSQRFLTAGGATTWEGGVNYWRVQYKAGYNTLPDDLEEAAAQIVAALFWQTKRDPGLAQDWVPGVANRTPLHQMPKQAQQILNRYKRQNMYTFGG